VSVFDEAEIDDQAIVADSQAASVVSSASNRNMQIMLAAEIDCRDHVRHVSALGDQTRLSDNHGVIDFARFLVTCVGWLDQLTPELIFELIDNFRLHGFLHIR
jgi:hypothetical protein